MLWGLWLRLYLLHLLRLLRLHLLRGYLHRSRLCCGTQFRGLSVVHEITQEPIEAEREGVAEWRLRDQQGLCLLRLLCNKVARSLQEIEELDARGGVDHSRDRV